MKRVVLLVFLQFFCSCLFAQVFEPYIPEAEMPDVVKVLPAPPQDPSSEFDRDIMRYMWGKQQRRDPARLEMAVRDAIWSMDTTLVILGEHFGLKISKEETPAIYEVLTRGITTIENIRFRPKAHYFRIRPFAYFKEPSISLRTMNGCPVRAHILPATPSGHGHAPSLWHRSIPLRPKPSLQGHGSPAKAASSPAAIGRAT